MRQTRPPDEALPFFQAAAVAASSSLALRSLAVATASATDRVAVLSAAAGGTVPATVCVLLGCASAAAGACCRCQVVAGVPPTAALGPLAVTKVEEPRFVEGAPGCGREGSSTAGCGAGLAWGGTTLLLVPLVSAGPGGRPSAPSCGASPYDPVELGEALPRRQTRKDTTEFLINQGSRALERGRTKKPH